MRRPPGSTPAPSGGATSLHHDGTHRRGHLARTRLSWQPLFTGKVGLTAVRARPSIGLRGTLAASVLILAAVAFPGTSGAAPSHQPDAWIKFCGAGNTCLFSPWHPWLGN